MDDRKKSHWNPFRKHRQNLRLKETDPAASPQRSAKSDTLETIIERVPIWSEEARPLKIRTWISYLYGFGDIILLLLPIYFLLLAIAVIALNGKPSSDSQFGKKVEVAMGLGPTMFPIVFAAISGRSMKMIARYLAEKGTKISTLELLMASQSVWGTIESQFLMQRLTLVGVNLMFLWALSPFGGQASLRLMTRENRDISTNAKLRYLTTGPGGAMWGLSTTYSGSGRYADAGALYTAALLAPIDTTNGPRDPWGNVKIPNLEYISKDSSVAADDNGWIVVPSIQEPELYSSLVGLPVVGLPLAHKSNFTIESTYLVVDCSRFNQTPYPGINSTNRARTDFVKLDQLVPGQLWLNKSETNPFEPILGRKTSFFIDTNLGSPWSEEDSMYEALLGRLDGFIGNINHTRLTNSEAQALRELTYTSLYATSTDDSTFGLNIARCKLSQKHVETMVICNGIQCAASKIRNSLTDTRPAAFTAFEHGVIMRGFAEQFPLAVDFSAGSSPSERYLANSSSYPFIQRAGQLTEDIIYSNLSLVEPEKFSRRLSSILNTYYQLTIQPTGYFGSLPGNLTLYGPDTLPVNDVNVYLPSNFSATKNSFFDWWPAFDKIVQTSESPFIGATTEATVTVVEEKFVCNFAWLVMLMISSTTIFVVGGAAWILKQRTLGPEMFGSVASMTYENPWIKIPRGGTTMDAIERARMLKDIDFQVGDVRGEDDVGHIALAAGVPLRKLERGRLYS